MKSRFIGVLTLVFVFAIASIGLAAALKDDTQFLGKVTKIDAKAKKLTIETIGEKKAQTFEFNILDNALIMENSRGKILSADDIKAGVIVNINCWRKGDSLYARTIWVEFKEDYLTKAILKDAKEGKNYKEIEP